MNKTKIIKQIREQCNENKNRHIKSASKLFDYLKEHKIKKKKKDNKIGYKVGFWEDDYFINGHKCVCRYYDFYIGCAEFTPYNSTVDIGTGYAGATLRIEF